MILRGVGANEEKLIDNETLMTELNIFYLLQTIFSSKFSVNLKNLDLTRTEFRFAEFLNELFQTKEENWLDFLNLIKSSFTSKETLRNNDEIHRNLYPLGSIRAYQILGFMEENDADNEKRESAEQLLSLMTDAVNDIDELAESKYFYVSKCLHNCLCDVTSDYLENLLENIREASKPFRASALR